MVGAIAATREDEMRSEWLCRIWGGLREKFEGISRRVQASFKEIEERKAGGGEEEAKGPFGGMMDWGEPQVFTTKRE